jgi:hypothetical protein
MTEQPCEINVVESPDSYCGAMSTVCLLLRKYFENAQFMKRLLLKASFAQFHILIHNAHSKLFSSACKKCIFFQPADSGLFLLRFHASFPCAEIPIFSWCGVIHPSFYARPSVPHTQCADLKLVFSQVSFLTPVVLTKPSIIKDNF